MKTDYQSPQERWQQQTQASSNNTALWIVLGLGVAFLAAAGLLAIRQHRPPPQAISSSQSPTLPHDNALLQKANAGDAEAQYAIGRAADRQGDETKAILWYERAAQQGNAKAMNNAAVLYSRFKLN